MNLKAFFVATLQSALDLGIATPDDVIRHVTPDVLANHLPRPLWARLLTACVGAPRVDAQLVVETIGVPNLCEHIPVPIIWACIAELGQRSLGSLGGGVVTGPVSSKPTSSPIPIASPPPEREASAPVKTGPSTMFGTIPTPATTETDDSPENQPTQLGLTRTPAGRPAANRFRQASTGIGRLASTNNQPQPSASTSQARRPQAQAAPPSPPQSNYQSSPIPSVVRPKRGQTDADFEVETDISKDDWKNAIAVDDEQLVDWAASDETVTSAEELTNRKR